MENENKNKNNAPEKPEVKKASDILKEKAAKQAGKFSSAQKSRLLRLVIVLILILVITNPALIPFLPASVEAKLVGVMENMFGDVSQISKVVPMNWIVLFKLVVMALVIQIGKLILSVLLSAMNPKTNRGKTIHNLVLDAFNYLVGFVTIFWTLSILGVDLSTLFASLGILALIVGFGAESLIADMVTGLFMIFENEYNVGDIVEVGGFRGTVSSIGIRTTSITDGGGNVKIFNNSDMRNIINQSARGSVAVCDFSIPYEIKIADAEKALEKVLTNIQKEYPDVFEQAPKYAGVQLLGDSAVVLRVTANVSESNRFKAARLLNRGLKEGMEELGISCPYNQLVVHKAE